MLAKAVGRRKEAVAQVQIKQGTGQFIINNKPAQDYLQNDFYSLLTVKAPFDFLVVAKQSSGENLRSNTSSGDVSVPSLLDQVQLKSNLNLDTIVKVKGGGLMGQVEAIRLGISRALCLLISKNNFDSKSLFANSGNPELDWQSQQSAQMDHQLSEVSSNNTGEESLNKNTSVDSGLVLDIRKQLKDKGYLTQDSRVKERRKYGLKKARKASQYHKR